MMIGCLVKSATRLVMQNHFYSFNNCIRKQKKGGAIVSKLTERAGKILMKRHAVKYQMILEKSVPVLDLKVYCEDGQILHKFYEKPCAARMVIPFKSAHSKKMKMAV